MHPLESHLEHGPEHGWNTVIGDGKMTSKEVFFYWKFDLVLKYDFVWYHCVLKGFFGTQ